LDLSGLPLDSELKLAGLYVLAASASVREAKIGSNSLYGARAAIARFERLRISFDVAGHAEAVGMRHMTQK
jgi:hypothetical protein